MPKIVIDCTKIFDIADKKLLKFQASGTIKNLKRLSTLKELFVRNGQSGTSCCLMYGHYKTRKKRFAILP